MRAEPRPAGSAAGLLTDYGAPMDGMSDEDLDWMVYINQMKVISAVRTRMHIEPKTVVALDDQNIPHLKSITLTFDEFVRLAGPHLS